MGGMESVISVMSYSRKKSTLLLCALSKPRERCSTVFLIVLTSKIINAV